MYICVCVCQTQVVVSEAVFLFFRSLYSTKNKKPKKITEDSSFIYVRCRNLHLSIKFFIFILFYIKWYFIYLFLLFILDPDWISIPIVHLLCEGIGRAAIINWNCYILLTLILNLRTKCTCPVRRHWARCNYQLILLFCFVCLLTWVSIPIVHLLFDIGRA